MVGREFLRLIARIEVGKVADGLDTHSTSSQAVPQNASDGDIDWKKMRIKSHNIIRPFKRRAPTMLMIATQSTALVGSIDG